MTFIQTPALSDQESELIIRTNESVKVDFGGGSSALKSLIVANLVKERKFQTLLEVGVYRGRFFLPQAAFLKSLSVGKIFGVDPYSAVEAKQKDIKHFPSEILSRFDSFLRETDWDEMFLDVNSQITALNADAHAELIRTTSRNAAKSFEVHSLDLIHIDGNHDSRAVSLDLKAWTPKLKRGGILVMDDCSWPSIRPIAQRLERKGFRRLLQFFDWQTDDFAIFEKA